MLYHGIAISLITKTALFSNHRYSELPHAPVLTFLLVVFLFAPKAKGCYVTRMTKIFQVIIGLLRRHLVLFGIYRKYLKRFRRYESAENLCKHSNSEEDLIYLARKRRYHSAGETDSNWYRTKENYKELKLRIMPCDTADNWLNYEDNMVARHGFVNTVFVTNSTQFHDEDTNVNDCSTLNDNWCNGNCNPIIVQSDFSLDGVIGSGGFGCVFLGRYGGRRVAVKSVRQSSKNREAQ